MKLKRNGYALATILVLLGVALFGIGALVTVSTLESKIYRSQIEGTVAYYVADAGVADAVWHLNNNASWKSALQTGTLNVSYTVNNVPQAGQGFTVTMKTSSQGAGYADITVNATSDNGNFTAKRAITSNIYLSPNAGSFGSNVAMVGGNFSFSNGSGAVNITNGDLAAQGNITVSRTTLNMSSRWIRTPANYTVSNSSVNAAGIAAANYPPAGTSQAVPGVDFSYFSSNANKTYTANNFTSLIENNTNINLPGPITYVNGSVTLGNRAKNKNITVNGVLVFSGSFTISNSASNLVINLNDPGNGKSGLLTQGNLSLSAGNLNLNGVVYAAGNIAITSVPNLIIQGALVSGGNTAITPGSNTTLNFVTSRPQAIFNYAANQAINLNHWEEEY